ncbi:MAG TPA: phosphoenolpyruvate--protein phosphotransferase [Anaerolineales bacterium]|nr:phosphoenolpyruvate--protein phosphotransferase [Anaerolineales bacterium]
MVSLVLVSHSRQLAEALEALVRQVAPGDLPVAIAAGAGVDHQEFGTDPLEIANAIQSVYSEAGVIVLMDLGSAVLSAEMAIEFLPEEQRQKVRCCPGPLVEGAIAAAVQAGAGGGLDEVCREARQALEPKVQHLEQGQLAGDADLPARGTTPEGELHTTVLTLHNEHGLHARPAARLVKAAAPFSADIQVTNLSNGRGPATAKSLNALATLGAISGDRISVTASGPDAGQALAALRLLVDDNFGLPALPEFPKPPLLPFEPARAPATGSSLQGIPVAEGIALGPLVFYRLESSGVTEENSGDPEREWQRLQEAIGRIRALLDRRRLETLSRTGELQAEIFAAHRLILDDPTLQAEVRERIFNRGQPAGLAWRESINQAIDAYRSLEDAYLRARSTDVSDVGEQVALALQGESDNLTFHLDEPGVLYADALTPAQVMQLDQTRVEGLVIFSTGPTSHSAILARAFGIPSVTGIDLKGMGIEVGTLIALDGSTGAVWLDPDREVWEALTRRRKAWLDRRQELLENSQAPAITRDGRRIEIAANVGSLAEARAALKNGAEGIGVLRTEFLYLSRSEPPGEAEQLAVLSQIGEALGGRRVIVRTLDIGGDKFLPYLQLPKEANPYLGVRGLRLSMRQPELFQVQLRAILRAGRDFPVSMMFPMVSTLEEVSWAKEQLHAAHLSLEKESLPHRWPVETGIMVEVPSAALLASSIAPLVDFFSIGTNDLTQYTLAAERGNPQLAGFGDALHPSVLLLIKQVVEAAHSQGKWVGVCGEIAADPQAAPVLVGLGVDELSMNSADIPTIKSVIRRLDFRVTQEFAAQALTCTGAQEVRSVLRENSEKSIE